MNRSQPDAGPARQSGPRDGREADADLVVVGGGLAGCLIAWRLDQLRPSLHVRVLEAGQTLGGNHTWSFHASDLAPAQLDWMLPLVAHRWPGHEVRFPGFSRQLDGAYMSITSDSLHAVLHKALGSRVQFGAKVLHVDPTNVRLADGTTISARAVIDARGPRHSAHLDVGYQKFLGQVLRLDQPHGLTLPILMDATVDQQGGYRFVYVLPLSPDALLIEDTCYADGPDVDPALLRMRIAAYARSNGWTVEAVLREEEGVLPILLDGDIAAFWDEQTGVPRAGLSAGLFHPTTGYSLPEAVALAELTAAQPRFDAASLHAAIRAHALGRWRAGHFFRMLNRMLFRAAAPAQRRQVMARFYTLDAGLIARFYAARLRTFDKVRLLTGRPPVPLGAALRAVLAARGAGPNKLKVSA
jgi:lycopene beta-cyclase